MANKLDIKTVDEVAHLSRLEFTTDAEKEKILNDMSRMLGFIDKLNELDTSNIEPLIYMTNEKNILRADEFKITLTQKEALKNAPKKDSDYFKVPKVIDQH